MAKLDSKTKALLATAITKALAYQENGGAPNLEEPSSGKTGELKSIFQFEPATWKKEAGEFLGNANAPINPDAETTVVMKQVGQWLDKGYTAKQIASMWNAGSGEPDAYTGKFSDGSPSIGTNQKYGVKFNVPAYANHVSKYANQFYQELEQKGNQANATPTEPQQTTSQGGNTLATIQGMVQNAKTQTQPSGGLMQQAA